MNNHEGKQAEILQLKQLVIHLQAELNKYKMNPRNYRDELTYEQESLLAAHDELVYTSEKQAKRIGLYEKQLKSLASQRDEALATVKQLRNTEENLNTVNDQLAEELRTMKEEIISAVKNSLSIPGTTTPKQTDQNLFEISKSSSGLTQTNQEEPNSALEKLQEVNETQKELIRILEEYVQRLSEK